MKPNRTRLAAFTIVELMVAIMMSSMVVMMFFGMYRTWTRANTKANVQSELYTTGRVALDMVLRNIREEMVGLASVRLTTTEFQDAFAYIADTDHDTHGDSLRAWGLAEMDADGDGEQDKVDSDGDGVLDTELWSLVYAASSSTNLGDATWTVRTVCRNIVAPWSTDDGKHVYRPFEFTGSDVDLDLGPDGGYGTGDAGENDGLISEVEIGNYANGNGVIDKNGELGKITGIAIGLKMLKPSTISRVESLVLFQGVVKPRNWPPMDI